MKKMEAFLRQGRAAVLIGVTALAWAYLFLLSAYMPDMETAMTAARVRPWSVADFWLTFPMWAVMMVGMMVPSAAPMILLFVGVQRNSREKGGAFIPTGVFLSGYLIAWTVFSLAAAAAQWALGRAVLLSPMMASESAYLGGALLLAAGIFQLTPLKNACLAHCRSPLHFISHSWRPGLTGALRMGVHHGAFCVGCCWALMGLLFAAGVMNLLWVAVIAGFVLLEKMAPFGVRAGRWSGIALMLLAGWMVWRV